jgi:hypothetical protein
MSATMAQRENHVEARPRRPVHRCRHAAELDPEAASERTLKMNKNLTEDDLLTPTESDLDSCYGSRFYSAADLGDKKIRTKVAKADGRVAAAGWPD